MHTMFQRTAPWNSSELLTFTQNNRVLVVTSPNADHGVGELACPSYRHSGSQSAVSYQIKHILPDAPEVTLFGALQKELITYCLPPQILHGGMLQWFYSSMAKLGTNLHVILFVSRGLAL